MKRMLCMLAVAAFTLYLCTQRTQAQVFESATAVCAGNPDPKSGDARPDLAISLGDVQLHDGLLRVRVHNVGTEVSSRSKVALIARGRILALAPLPEIQAPVAGSDAFSEILLPIPLSVSLNECSIVADPEGMLHEITLKNNRIDLKEISPMSNTSRTTATIDSGTSHNQPPRLEHLAFNVKEPQAIALWYVNHLGMKIYRSGPPPGSTRFVGDAAGNLMFELYNNPAAPPLDYPTFSHMSMHVAFMVDDVKSIRDSLLAAGARVVEDIATIPSGDQVLMMRDPFGLAIQFVMRIHPMLKPSGIRFEHLALNLSDPQKVTDWYLEHLGFKVMRKGGAPNFTTFVSDAGGHMMMELFINNQYPLLDFSKIDHHSLHFAFTVDDVRSLRDSLIAAGATIAEEVRETNTGDQVLVLRDPWGFAIQFIKRGEAMLK